MLKKEKLLIFNFFAAANINQNNFKNQVPKDLEGIKSNISISVRQGTNQCTKGDIEFDPHLKTYL